MMNEEKTKFDKPAKGPPQPANMQVGSATSPLGHCLLDKRITLRTEATVDFLTLTMTTTSHHLNKLARAKMMMWSACNCKRRLNS
jgi:hypothetical protein